MSLDKLDYKQFPSLLNNWFTFETLKYETPSSSKVLLKTPIKNTKNCGKYSVKVSTIT